MKKKVTAVFDIGRTNKKFFLFDADFREVRREYARLPETEDEDGYPSEDPVALRGWLREVFDRVLAAKEFEVEAINFSSYGASFVHLDENGDILTPLYNYTKPIDPALLDEFYERYGPEPEFCARTGSARAGMLNSGLQLYWLKLTRPEVFRRIRYSLHLPQFLSYVFTGIPLSEYTSIGCHTALWDYAARDYHSWVYAEGLHRILPPIVSTATSINMNYAGRRMQIGVGIHDSSAALLPYVKSSKRPFVLVSTGTWSVSLNPFAQDALSPADLEENCSNFLRLDGRPVRASRLFLGEEYQRQVKRLAEHFGVPAERHKSVAFDCAVYTEIMTDFAPWFRWEAITATGMPDRTTLPTDSYEYAYHHLMIELVLLQVDSIRAAAGTTAVRKLYLDGGFSDNEVYVQLLSHYFRDWELRTTSASLGSALGAALAITDATLDGNFLKKNYSLRKHRPFILQEPESSPSENQNS